jgi:hypothetical protein
MAAPRLPARLTPPPQRPRATAFSSGIVLRPVTLREDEVTLDADLDDPDDATQDVDSATRPQRVAPRALTMVPPARTPRPAFTPQPIFNAQYAFSTQSAVTQTAIPSAPPAPSSQPVMTMAANTTAANDGPMSSAADIPTVRPPRPDAPGAALVASVQAHPAIGWLLAGFVVGAVAVFVPMSMRDTPRAPSTPATVYVPIASPPPMAAQDATKGSPKTTVQAATNPMPIPTVSADDLPKTKRRR